MSPELHLAMTEAVHGDVERRLFPEGAAPNSERGVIGIVHWSQGRRRHTMLLCQLVQARPGDVVWNADDGLVFSTSYKSRAVDEANRVGAGLIFLHTHPTRAASPGFPVPSPEDLWSDRRDLYALGRALSADVPLSAGILASGRHWHARAYTFRFPKTLAEIADPSFGEKTAVVQNASAIRIVGPSLRKFPTAEQGMGPGTGQGRSDTTAQDSSVRLWGDVGQRMLAALRVGLPGAGGVGGILAEYTARLGVGEQVIVDFDQLGPDNANRSHGASRDEVRFGARKAFVAARLAQEGATAPDFDVRAIIGSVVEVSTVPDLLDCDIILNAADSPWARQVLDQLAYAHLIPVINGGTLLLGDTDSGRTLAGKCEVAVAGPGHPCMRCCRVYSLEEVTEAQTSPECRGRRYIEGANEGDGERAPSVISTNALVAGMMLLRLQALTLGTTPQAVVGVQRYHVLEGILSWASIKACSPDCQMQQLLARGNRVDLPVGVDLDMRRRHLVE